MILCTGAEGNETTHLTHTHRIHRTVSHPTIASNHTPSLARERRKTERCRRNLVVEAAGVKEARLAEVEQRALALAGERAGGGDVLLAWLP